MNQEAFGDSLTFRLIDGPEDGNDVVLIEPFPPKLTLQNDDNGYYLRNGGTYHWTLNQVKL